VTRTRLDSDNPRRGKATSISLRGVHESTRPIRDV